jgi:hypothetical protein
MVEPVRRSVTWTRSGSPEDALRAVEEYGITHIGRPKKGDSPITLIFGSRLAFRLMGISTDRIPYTVRVTAAPSQGTATTLTAEASSDTGPYLFRTEFATHLYERLLSHTLWELQQL